MEISGEITHILRHCRLCQQSEGVLEVVSDQEFISQTFECIGIKINDYGNNSLPKSVCVDCKVKIQDFFVYVQRVRDIDKKLHIFFNNIPKKEDCTEITTPLNNDEDLLGDNNSEMNTLKCDIKCESVEKTIKTERACRRKRGCYNETWEEANICETPPEISSSGVKTELSKPKIKKKSKGGFKCKICQEVFVHKVDLWVHRKSHKNSFVCKWENCGKVCTSAYTLKTHEMKHEGKRPFLCVTCGKGFITKNSLNCHEKIHLETKGYMCKLCNIGFSVRSNLRAHEKKHHEGVRFYCSQCTRAFITKCSLDRHERLHTGIKEYRCESCPSAFYTNKELVKHQRYHQGIRQHKCDQCFKTFFEKHHLTVHLRAHTGERPYVCRLPGCEKSFTESQKLTRHLKARHPITS